ncbi:nickel insertion protein [Paenibacillus sp. MBLB4367]|uniref:nickel insertion protein n=1 Tax=Paenibacillus sp. MBLB4367 TaxID=3384767 RepID=UPI0039080059
MTFAHREEHRDGQMIVIQANIDDMNPEHCPYVTDRLLEQGANDVWWIPIIMKKGRPGLMLNVLVDERSLSPMEDIIFAETTTIGLRYMHATCHRLGREFRQVETPWGVISVKAGYHDGKLVQYAPEFKDCEEAAKRHGVPLKAVYEAARMKFAEEDQ